MRTVVVGDPSLGVSTGALPGACLGAGALAVVALAPRTSGSGTEGRANACTRTTAECDGGTRHHGRSRHCTERAQTRRQRARRRAHRVVGRRDRPAEPSGHGKCASSAKRRDRAVPVDKRTGVDRRARARPCARHDAADAGVRDRRLTRQRRRQRTARADKPGRRTESPAPATTVRPERTMRTPRRQRERREGVGALRPESTRTTSLASAADPGTRRKVAPERRTRTCGSRSRLRQARRRRCGRRSHGFVHSGAPR